MNKLFVSRIANAYKNSGTESINGFKKILFNLISDKSKKILKNNKRT